MWSKLFLFGVAHPDVVFALSAVLFSLLFFLVMLWVKHLHIRGRQDLVLQPTLVANLFHVVYLPFASFFSLFIASFVPSLVVGTSSSVARFLQDPALILFVLWTLWRTLSLVALYARKHGLDGAKVEWGRKIGRSLVVLIGTALLAHSVTFLAQGVTFLAQGVTFLAQGVTFLAQGVTFLAQGVTFLAHSVGINVLPFLYHVFKKDPFLIFYLFMGVFFLFAFPVRFLFRRKLKKEKEEGLVLQPTFWANLFHVVYLPLMFCGSFFFAWIMTYLVLGSVPKVAELSQLFVMTLFVFWSLWRSVPLMALYARKHGLDGAKVEWGRKIGRGLVVLIGTAFLAHSVGINVLPFLHRVSKKNPELAFFLFFAVFLVILLAVVKRTFQSEIKREKEEGLVLQPTFLANLFRVVHFPLMFCGSFFCAWIITNLFLGAASKAADRLQLPVMTLFVFWSLWRGVPLIARYLKTAENGLNVAVVEWGSNVVRVLVALTGIATLLQSIGVQVAPILASLGLLGVAVALGAQDLFKNLIAGFLVVAERRFNVGDWVKVDGVVEGIVESIGFRSTRVRRFDKAPVFVPNNLFSEKSLTNFTALPFRRIRWTLQLEYTTTVSQLRAIRTAIEDSMAQNPDFVASTEVEPYVRVSSFADSSIDMLVCCYTRAVSWTEWMRIREAFLLTLKDIVEKGGSAFAFPSRTVYLMDKAEA